MSVSKSALGVHVEPFHFRTCPVEGVVELTSDKFSSCAFSENTPVPLLYDNPVVADKSVKAMPPPPAFATH